MTRKKTYTRTAASVKAAETKKAPEVQKEAGTAEVKTETEEVKAEAAEPKAEEVKAEETVKAEELVSKTAEKAAEAAGKAAEAAEKTGKKIAAAAKKAVKKTAAKKTEVKTGISVQYMGKDVSDKEMIALVKKDWTAKKNKIGDIKSMQLYVKVEENKVYYVINETETGSVDI
ncbi:MULTISPECIES: DUF6465 family protein [unclassified Candidatus Paralachnospira]|uniref:DUF6465 family protein n=1 Tax=unclassified Candidatus Paralachnospira TaxID=3099471 RepID=UPI003F92CF8E